jgi:hypothetical protein
VPFGRKFNANNRVHVKKIVTIVFMEEISCLVLDTTSLAEVANIESPYVVERNHGSLLVLIPSKLCSAYNWSMSRSISD